jgi:hypothetical protein
VALATLVLMDADCVPASASEAGAIRWLADLSLPSPTWSQFVVCHGYNCHTRTLIGLGNGDRAALAKMVRGPTPDAERRGLARAMAWFDKRVASQTGTASAKAYARGLQGDTTQFDCIDRSANTTSLLLVLAQSKMLQHHEVDVPESRKFVPILEGPHTTAVVREKKSGIKWVVDPWTHNSGEQPDVMPLDKWLAIRGRYP